MKFRPAVYLKPSKAQKDCCVYLFIGRNYGTNQRFRELRITMDLFSNDKNSIAQQQSYLNP